MPLSDRDARIVLEAAAFLTEATTLEEFIGCALPAARHVAPGHIAFYDELDLVAGRARTIGDPQEPRDTTRDAWQRRMHEHPVVAHARRTGERAPRRISDFLDRRSFRRTALFDEVYRPIDVDDQLGAPIAVSSSRVIGVAVSRSGRAFEDAERERFEALRPFLTAAHRRVELERLAPPLDDLGLTRREGQILALAMRGHTNREIAETLVLSPRTVAKHLEHAYAKFGVGGRRDAARRLGAAPPISTV